MEYIYNDLVLQHDTDMHPENRKRLASFANVPPATVPDGAAFLSLVHTAAYIEKVRFACKNGLSLDPDTLTSPSSFIAATAAVGAAILASEQNGFALIRPPGHHAYADKGTGFCLFNNVAIAAQKLVNEGKRVLIFDFDGHCGDGTADIFYDTDQVLVISLHQSPAFPYKGRVHEIGEGKGKGYTVHVPIAPGSGDDIFWDAVETFLPIGEQFKPDVVAISAGFDAHQHDLLLELEVTTDCFYKIGKTISERFDNTFALLEGGYNLDYLPNCIRNFHAGMNGLEMPFHEEATTSGNRMWEHYNASKFEAMMALRTYWKF